MGMKFVWIVLILLLPYLVFGDDKFHVYSARGNWLPMTTNAAAKYGRFAVAEMNKMNNSTSIRFLEVTSARRQIDVTPGKVNIEFRMQVRNGKSKDEYDVHMSDKDGVMNLTFFLLRRKGIRFLHF